jgi:hypothetical protein
MVWRGIDVIFLFPVVPYDCNIIIYIWQSWGTFVDKVTTEWSRFNSWERGGGMLTISQFFSEDCTYISIWDKIYRVIQEERSV